MQENEKSTTVLAPSKKMTPDEEMASIREKLDEEVRIYNDGIKTRAMPICNAAVENITELLKSFMKVSEKKTFKELAAYDNVMLEAAIRLDFPIVKVEADKANNGIEYLKIVDSTKRIDPLRLDDYCDGIGYDRNWKYMVERLNLCVTARRAMELGINPTDINDSYSMKKESKKIEGFKTPIDFTEEQKAAIAKGKVVHFDYNAANKALTEDIQRVVTAMLGDGYYIGEHSTAYLLAIYSKRSNKKALNVVCSNHKFMRSYMLDICHKACTTDTFSITYKKSKDK